MTRGGQLIERVIAKRLRSSSVRETRPIPDAVVEVLRFINLLAESCQLMANRGDLRRRIIGEALCKVVVGYGHSAEALSSSPFTHIPHTIKGE